MLKHILIAAALFVSAPLFADKTTDSFVCTVTNSKQEPIANAQVTILSGESLKVTEFTTDDLGQVFLPSNLEAPLTIKINAEGFISEVSSHLELTHHDFTLADKKSISELEVSGKTINYGRLKKDGFVDFALVIPALKQEDIIFFDVSDIISPLTDKVVLKSVGQEIDVPSNISLPRQSENYLFFNIKINKPQYRLKLKRQGQHNIVATHGKFNLKKVIKGRKKSTLGLLEHFEFLSSGNKEKVFTGETPDFDIDVNQVQFTKTQSVTAPNYSEESTVISIALANKGDKFYPSDVKKLTQNETKDLKFPDNTKGAKILSALIDKDVDFSRNRDKSEDNPSSGIAQMSVTFSKPNTKINFLNLVEPPIVTDRQILISPPELPSELKQSGVLIILSEIEKIEGGALDTEKRTRLWQGRSYSWINGFDLPAIANNLDPEKNYRWEVLFMAQDKKENLPIGIKNITHLTRNAFDF